MVTTNFEIRLKNVLAQTFPVSYESYIRSKRWRRKAEAAKARALWQCQGCGRSHDSTPLQAHHRTYARLGFEIKEDITVLCDDCHKAITQVRRRIYNKPVRRRQAIRLFG